MTYMATIEKLCIDKKLEKVSGLLDRGEMPLRAIYLLPAAAEWMRNVLPGLKADGFNDGAVSPNQQAFVLLRDFVVGRDMFADDMYPKPMRPDDVDHGIWELRTADLRFFGWFVRKGCFVVSSVETKEKLLLHKLYAGHREQAIQRRNALDLDDPKFLKRKRKDVF
ncbi:hypothetical protein K3556_01470 [Aliiroseovarius sp. M344]|uniref:hypothetical protein n=1 Tax=Aliiroseovarius sp. M344 TaxID=2867010 RepID=UPI0021ADBB35|nr:hypothetical protein [Aliiroseovarius sp. M344]UWQ14588.1 hypothetical protein K3556_01470 [Aliiroseovarius sp. M344]